MASVPGATQATEPSRRSRIRTRRLLADIVIYLLLLLGVAAVILPFLYMIASSLETLAQIGALTPQFWPNPFEWSNYTSAWNQLPMGQFFVNSLLVGAITTIAQL